MKNLPSLRQLHALMLISETGSFTRTADLLSVTQSAVSILIRELEAEVGAQLVYRGRTASLTAGGQRLERAARRAWREIEQAQREVREHRENAQAVIRLAVGSLSAATFVPRALAMLEADPQSNLRVELLDGPMTMLADLLISGDADVGIGSVDLPIRKPAVLKSEILDSDTLCAVAAARSRFAELFAKHKRLGWETLAGQPLVFVSCRGVQWQQLLLKQMAAHEGLYRAQEVQLFSTAIALAREGLGIAIVPSAAARDLGPDCLLRPVDDADARWSTYWVTRRESSVPADAMECLKRAIVQAMRDVQPTRVRRRR